MTPNEFELWQKQEIDSMGKELSNEDFEFYTDMLSLQEHDSFDPNDKNIIYQDDQGALIQTNEGLKAYYTDITSIKYEQSLRSQKRKNLIKIVE